MRILEGARRCFARHGYEGATVARLEAETGLSRGAIFNWFHSKDELFYALAVEDSERHHRAYLDSGFEGLVREVLGQDPAWLGVYLEVARRMRTDEAFATRMRRRLPELRESVLRRIEEEQEAGTLRSDLSASALTSFVDIVLDGLVVYRAAGVDPPPAEVVLRLLRDAIGGQPRS